jgi:hypothetical protein
VYLVQFLLPLYSSHGRKIPQAEFASLLKELTGRFGGATAYSQAPALGLWKRHSGNVERDQVILVEVVAKRFNSRWWRGYRKALEQRFDQEKLLARVLNVKTF